VYNSNSNTIHTSPEDNGGEDFQRGMANWWLSILCGDAITGKSEWASNTLEKILSWYGQDNSLSLYDAQGKPTERYDKLQQIFATTFIAWLVKGDNLPQVAIPVGNALRSRYSSSMQMAGAKLTPEIGMIFCAMLDAEEKQLIEKDQSQQNTKEKFELHDSDSKAKGERTISIIELLIGRREDILGRLRVVVAPLMLPAAANIAGADVRGLSDWEGFFSSVSDLFYLDPLSGVIAIALLALGVWVISGTLEGTIRWLIYGSRARGAEPPGSGASVEGPTTKSRFDRDGGRSDTGFGTIGGANDDGGMTGKVTFYKGEEAGVPDKAMSFVAGWYTRIGQFSAPVVSCGVAFIAYFFRCGL